MSVQTGSEHGVHSTGTTKISQAAHLLIEARRTGALIDGLPEELRPVGLQEAYEIQDAVAKAFGPVGGWKIGASSIDATPLFAPMPAAWFAPGGSILKGERWRFRALEAEIAFLMGRDLEPRDTPYSREEVIAAIASCHPAIEVLETALTALAHPDKQSALADLQLNGGFVYGPAAPDWQRIDFTRERVAVRVDGQLKVERTGSNTAVDLVRLLVWLANEGASRTGGLRAGQWITTGSWSGNTPVLPGEAASVQFSSAGDVTLQFV